MVKPSGEQVPSPQKPEAPYRGKTKRNPASIDEKII
jgi:hypothetical protein